ncbi:unnamed protein product [Protopolystoma xenopodis]|uniref:Uncharacterized protein n=1 Tax=Protopolystoma xenopodis TaxID=117903 RepID=A0A448X977_9PLAT|nr:unnamed protein product [Protopolystoma xenopodis]
MHQLHGLFSHSPLTATDCSELIQVDKNRGTVGSIERTAAQATTAHASWQEMNESTASGASDASGLRPCVELPCFPVGSTFPPISTGLEPAIPIGQYKRKLDSEVPGASLYPTDSSEAGEEPSSGAFITPGGNGATTWPRRTNEPQDKLNAVSFRSNICFLSYSPFLYLFIKNLIYFRSPKVL